MKSALVLILMLYSVGGIAQQGSQPGSPLVKKILETYSRFFEFDNIYDGMKENVGDSIDKYNDSLISLITAPEFGSLKDKDYSTISKTKDINVLYSHDKKLMIVSWRMLINIPQQECINILWVGGKPTKMNSMRTDSDGRYRNYVQINKIVDFNLQGRVYYLLMGSNRIGNLDIQEMISAFYIGVNGELNPAGIFYDGKKYSQELGFDYILNEEIRVEPTFVVEGDELTCPVFNEHRTKVVGYKRYKIKPAGSPKFHNSK